MIKGKKIFKIFLFVSISLLKVNFSFAQPNTIPNLLLWLSGDSLVTDDGFGNVTQWGDITGNYNFTQPTVGQQPAKVFSSMFRSQAISFDGNLKSLVNSSVLVPANFSSQRTSMIIFWGLHGTVPQYGVVSTKNGNGYWRYGGDGNGYMQNFRNARLEGYPSGMPNSGIHISSLVISNTNYEFFNDGNSLGIQLTDWGTGTDFTIGKDEQGNFLDGEVAEVILYNDSLSGTQRQQVEQYIHDKYAPPANLGSDITVTNFCSTVIDAGFRYQNYLWSTGETTQSITVSSAGTYYVTVLDIFGAVTSDTIQVTYPTIHELPPNNNVCLSDSVLWNTNLSSGTYSFLWNTADTTSSIYIKNAGQYWVTVTDSLGCFKTSDTLNFAVDSFPVTASLGSDSIFLCIGNTLGLVQGASLASSYLWSPSGDTTATLHIFTSGSYSLTAIDTNGCVRTDSTYATIVGLPPVANFLSTSVCEGAVTQFTDSSYDPTTGNSVVAWLWDFGDGFTDTLQNTSHTFATFGNHTVVLTVTSNYGCPDNDTATVVVHPLPVASFINTNPCKNVAVQFNSTSTIDTSSSIANYLWNFGDPASGGANSSASQNPTHVYNAPGNNIVSLITTSNFGCSDTAVDVLIIRNSSTPHFLYLPTCYGSLMQFTNLSAPASLDIAWSWDFGDGSGSNPLENPTHLYGIAQTYNVTLTVFASTGCVTSATTPVTVSPLPVAAFVHAPACIGVPYQFIDSSHVASGSITAWDWHFDTLDSSNVQNPFFTFPDTGNYNISLKVYSNIGSGVNCTNSISRTIHVNPLPVANFSFNPQFGNPPQVVVFTNLTSNVNANTYAWDFGDGGTSALINPQHLYTDTSLFPLQLIATTPFGCKDTSQKNIYIIRPILDLALIGLSSSYVLDNHLHIIVDLANLGTRPIDKFKIQSRLADGTPIEEPFLQTLSNGYQGQMELSSSLDLGSGLAKYYCVSAVKPNDVDDDVLQNNEICKNLTNDFIVVNPYPNPFNDHLVFQLILPYKGDLSIEVFDLLGRKLTIYEGVGHEGSNLFAADLSDHPNGTYTVRFKFLETEIVKSVVKVERKK